MDRFTELKIFVAVAKLRSFSGAAQSLGLTTACVSRAVSGLEARSGARLFHRTTRRVCLADGADAFYQYCESILSQIDAAESSLQSSRQELSGTLRLIVHPSAAGALLADLLNGYRKRAPHVAVEVGVSEAKTDIATGGYEIGILPPHLIANTTVVSRLIRTSRRILVASAAYLDAHGRPRVPADLSGHAVMRTPDQDRRADARLIVHDGIHASELRIEASVWANDAVLRSCAEAGLGIALVSADLARPALAGRTLEQVLPECMVAGADTQLCLAYPSRKYMPARSRAFVDHCLGLFGQYPSAARPYAASTHPEPADAGPDPTDEQACQLAAA